MTSRGRVDKAEMEAENEVDRFLASLGKEMDRDSRKAEQRATNRSHEDSLARAVEQRRGSIPDAEVDAFLQSFFVADEVAKADKKFKGGNGNEEKKGSGETASRDVEGLDSSLADGVKVEVVAQFNESDFQAENGDADGGRESLGRESTRDSIDVSDFADAHSPGGRGSLDGAEADKLDVGAAVQENEGRKEREKREQKVEVGVEEEEYDDEEEEGDIGDQIPTGWEALLDDEGHEYFFNKDSGKLVFSREALMAQVKDVDTKTPTTRTKKKKSKKRKPAEKRKFQIIIISKVRANSTLRANKQTNKQRKAKRRVNRDSSSLSKGTRASKIR